ncbi:MAG TPA: hypothetical protein VLB67_05420 [Acidimicrobiia bacterium]|nr:hypothetical protein [Acidimicrobiia bacterium]
MTDTAAAKLEAEALVRTAQALVAKARDEASSIVRDGQRRVEGIVADADALRETAERQAAETRARAETLLHEAREQADRLLADARQAREEAVQSARGHLDVSQVPGQESPLASQHASSTAVEEASAMADRILRVARSEAEARGREITEDARRRAEQMERDARARVEMAAKEHRDMVRTMQQRELTAKARIRELDAEIARLERLLARVTDEAERSGIDTHPSADPADPREVTSSGIVFPADVQVADASPRTLEPSRAVIRPRPLERSDPPDDTERVALRGIRRRA